MKKLLFILAVCTLFVPNIYSRNDIISEERTVGDFIGIKVCCAIKVYISGGQSPKIKIEGRSEDLAGLDIKVKSGVLDISYKKGWKGNLGLNVRDVKVYVSAQNITFLNASAASKIEGQTTIKADKMRLRVDAAASIDANVEAGSLDCVADSKGSIKLSGKAAYAKVSADSMGDVSMQNTTVDKAEVKADSMGKVEITVKDELKAHADSMGKVVYYGNPSKVYPSSDSMGKVKKG